MLRLTIANYLRLGASLFTSLVICAGVMLTSSTQAQAEYLGLPTGRSAKISSLPKLAIEAGILTGDIGENSYQSLGPRVSFRLSPDFLVYGDVNRADIDDADGLAFGVGLFYGIPGLTKKNDFAAKVSYHAASLKSSDDKLKGNVLSIEGLLSGQKIGESDLRWYANFGLHRFDVKNAYDETEIGFGGGVFTETSFGELYGGIDLIDELTFGVGVRFHVQ